MGGDARPGQSWKVTRAVEELLLKVMSFAEEKPLQAAIKAPELQEAADQAAGQSPELIASMALFAGMDDEATSVRRQTPGQHQSGHVTGSEPAKALAVYSAGTRAVM